MAQTNIAMHFDEVAEFIDEALSSGGKKNEKEKLEEGEEE